MPDAPTPQTLSAEVMALARQAEGAGERLRAEMRQIMHRRRAYVRLFFTPEGALRPEGAIVLRDLIAAAEFGRASREVDNGSLQVLEGKRRLLLHLFGRFRLPEGRLADIWKTLRETEDEE